MVTQRPLKSMRLNCLECSGGSQKYVKFCTCDGLHSTACQFWPYRFGRRPESVADQRLVVPECMPAEDRNLDDLSDADLLPLPDGFQAPKPSRRTLTEEQKRKLAEGKRQARQAKEVV